MAYNDIQDLFHIYRKLIMIKLTDFREHLFFAVSYHLIDLEVCEVPQYVRGALLELLELLLAAVIRDIHDFDGRLVIPVHEDR
jgi:hypothetical protein